VHLDSPGFPHLENYLHSVYGGMLYQPNFGVRFHVSKNVSVPQLEAFFFVGPPGCHAVVRLLKLHTDKSEKFLPVVMYNKLLL
jgi:hypothetical protein